MYLSLCLVIADIFVRLEGAVKVRLNHGLRGIARRTDNRLDAILLEKTYRTTTHAAGNDYVRTLFREPRGKRARRVVRRNTLGPIRNFFLLLVYVEKDEFLRVAKMHAEYSVCDRYSNPHKTSFV